MGNHIIMSSVATIKTVIKLLIFDILYILQSQRIRRTTQVQQITVNHDSTVLYGSSNLQVTN